ncbi:S41 family peptidase [Chitinophaga nivalis]|uniref:S41 family peptidase n=1 Tax=Chitinophaga nivalis TaxID=2991709 RepID=A0ABT3IQU1_9BACT|nr:S41 family peptidase [Chitinophaga nivalis]MCW3463958.1 S41 family peptidase [Chitinophaga nivalis]MCW3486352.1 S41 family peptidase [Chitinophaga nivalis]
MKKVLFLLLFAHQVNAQSTKPASLQPPQQSDSLSIVNRQLAPGEMKKDLQLFLDIRKKANSGLYRYRSVKQIDSIYQWAFNQVRQPMSTTDFFKVIVQLTDFEGSCHNYTEPGGDLVKYFNRQRSFFPFALKYVEGNIIFNSKTPQIPVGARIVSINGVADKALMSSFYKYLTADGYTTTQKWSNSVNTSYGIRYLYEYGLKDSYTIRFIAPGATEPQTVTIPAVSLEERKANLALRYSAPVDSLIDYNVQPKYSFKMANPATGLLNLRIFTMADDANDPAFPVYVKFIDSVFQVLSTNNIPNLILDIRGNPGGSDPTFEQPMMYLTDASFKENTLAYTIFGNGIPYEKYFWGVSTSERMDSAAKVAGKAMLQDYFPVFRNGRNIQDSKHNPVYLPKQPRFKGKLYLLIDENVASAASHLASLVKAYANNVTIVGVETVGGYYYHNGHMGLIYELPYSKIKTKFSIVHVEQDAPLKPDQPEGRGIIPHHTVWTSFNDFMQQRDTQMEYVHKLIGGQF